jgi:eukaryotic-like serine/threonine-protein kinase
MTPERWQQVKDIFDRAVERAPASRIAFIRECCGTDDELRKEVESLLASDTETGSLLDAPTVVLRMAVDLPKQNLTRIGPYEMLRALLPAASTLVSTLSSPVNSCLETTQACLHSKSEPA